MQVHQGLQATVVRTNGKKEVVSAITAHFDALCLNKDAGKLSVEYAKARTAINEDFKSNAAFNQALAARIRKESKKVVVEALGGKVSTIVDESTKQKKLIVTFPDHTVARL